MLQNLSSAAVVIGAFRVKVNLLLFKGSQLGWNSKIIHYIAFILANSHSVASHLGLRCLSMFWFIDF